MAHRPLTEREEKIGKDLVDSAIVVHRTLGPGLLESVYEVCFCHEVMKRGYQVQRQVVLPIVYDGIRFDEGLKIDVLVEEMVICELKAVTEIHPVFKAQLLSYMKLTKIRLGYLLNFHTPLMKDGILRFVL